MIRVLSVDDHPLLREGIAALVNVESDMKLVAEASNGQEAIEKFRLHRPDVTLMDLSVVQPHRLVNSGDEIGSLWYSNGGSPGNQMRRRKALRVC